MRRRSKVAARAAVIVLLIPVVVLSADPAAARMAPETLGDRRPVQAGPVEPGFPIDYLGVLWDSTDHDHGHGAGGAAVRFRHEGAWGPWIDLVEDGVEAEGRWLSGLVDGGDAEAYQVRGVPTGAGNARAAAINTTDGPLVEVGAAPGGAAGAIDSASCRSRAEWGADPALMSWPAEHFPVQALTVHHTATKNNDTDPAATVRAIYRYHAVDNGWGDIGYHYLVDEAGVVYEGRWSGTDSQACASGGTGADFAHEHGSDQMVSAAHVSGANSGNVGVALLGDFTTKTRSGGDPKAAAVGALEGVLAELSLRHGLDPTGSVHYVNPVNNSAKDVAAISAHRDWSATECPGQRLYDQLPTIRQKVKDAIAGTGTDDGTPEDPAATASTATITHSWFGGKRNNQHVDITVQVTDEAGTAVMGAQVTATVEDSGGRVSTHTATTDSNGVAAIVSYRGVSKGSCFTTKVTEVQATPPWDGGPDSETSCQP